MRINWPSIATLLLLSPLIGQDQRPVSLPIQATGSVDTAPLATTGRATLRLRFVPEIDIGRRLSVRIEVRLRQRTLLRRDHAPPEPTLKWVKDRAVAYELPLAFSLPPKELQGGETLALYVGFHDPAEDKVAPPLTDAADADGLAKLCEFVFPSSSAEPNIEATIASATALAATDPAGAFDQLEFVFRRITDYRQKQSLQKALLTIGKQPAKPITFEENDIVGQRIGAERARYLRQVAGRMFDRGQLLGALLLLDEVGGALQEQADRAVVGALADAQRVTQDRDSIVKRVFAIDKAQQAEIDELVGRHKRPDDRLAVGRKLAKDPTKRAVARELVRTLEFTPELRVEAEAARKEIEQQWLADVPADQRAEADAARNHASWARTGRRLSHRFVLIGPQTLLDGIPADSLLRFDLAYLYLTDLFGRLPNPDGDRVTVYWKELWDFGGGIGGGKIIDIGRADPNTKSLRVDNGLLYHELTHCVDDTAPIYPGLREGLADFGAAFCQMELGQVAGGRAAIGLATRAFLQDYLERDLEYWRIPNYAPSAGLLLHFVVNYGKDGDGYRWDLYRRFFRDYRADPVKDGRTPTLARAFAFHLTEAFGPKAFDDLIRFRWPLLPADLEAVRLEQAAAEKRRNPPDLSDHSGSPLPRDRMSQRLQAEQADVAAYAQELGVVRDWWVIGPFRREGVDPDSHRFPPELEIDLAARYDSINNSPTWRRPGDKPVTVSDTGWLHFDFAYQDDSAIYALTHVQCESDLDAWFHLRADDDLTLFVDDACIGKYTPHSGQLGPWRPAARVMLPDAIRFLVPLTKGRHKVLLKIRNQGGPAGCMLAIAQRNGMPLSGWTTDVEPAAKKLAAIDWPDGSKWPIRLRLDFGGPGSHRKLETPIGKWRVRNGALEGFATDREVEWRKHTVRPGFPKDSPSNLAWLPENATEQLDAFSLSLDLPPDSAAPKVCITLQGEGQRDPLGGFALILEPDGGNVRAWIERYELRVYSALAMPWATDGKKPVPLRLQSWGGRLTVSLAGQVLFDQVSLQKIPGRHRIGIATWGEALRIQEIELRAPARTR